MGRKAKVKHGIIKFGEVATVATNAFFASKVRMPLAFWTHREILELEGLFRT